MDYILNVLFLIGIYCIAGMSCNMIAGFSGILALSTGAFAGIGAYTVALLTIYLNAPFLLSVIIALAMSTIGGVLISYPSTKLKGDYFILTTFAFQIVISNTLNNWVSFTKGPMGVGNINNLSLLGLNLNNMMILFAIECFVVLLIFLIIRRLSVSSLGRLMRAIKEDEILPEVYGYNIFKNKVTFFIISSCFAGIAGIFYAVFMSFIDPTSFTITESIFILSIVIIGGSGSLIGPLIGATILVLLPEFLRYIGLPSSISANIQQMIYGSLLIIFMLWKPRGIVGILSAKQNGR
jgi:branched-chain amino acid transport system permease protein